MSNKIQTCEFTLLRVYLAYLFSSPLYFSCFSKQFWCGSDRGFRWDLMWALYSILQDQEWVCPPKFSSAEAGSSVKTCLPAERMESGVWIMLHCLPSAETQLRLSFHSCRVSMETTAPTGRSRETWSVRAKAIVSRDMDWNLQRISSISGLYSTHSDRPTCTRALTGSLDAWIKGKKINMLPTSGR